MNTFFSFKDDPPFPGVFTSIFLKPLILEGCMIETDIVNLTATIKFQMEFRNTQNQLDSVLVKFYRPMYWAVSDVSIMVDGILSHKSFCLDSKSEKSDSMRSKFFPLRTYSNDQKNMNGVIDIPDVSENLMWIAFPISGKFPTDTRIRLTVIYLAPIFPRYRRKANHFLFSIPYVLFPLASPITSIDDNALEKNSYSTRSQVINSGFTLLIHGVLHAPLSKESVLDGLDNNPLVELSVDSKKFSFSYHGSFSEFNISEIASSKFGHFISKNINLYLEFQSNLKESKNFPAIRCFPLSSSKSSHIKGAMILFNPLLANAFSSASKFSKHSEIDILIVLSSRILKNLDISEFHKSLMTMFRGIPKGTMVNATILEEPLGDESNCINAPQGAISRMSSHISPNWTDVSSNKNSSLHENPKFMVDAVELEAKIVYDWLKTFSHEFTKNSLSTLDQSKSNHTSLAAFIILHQRALASANQSRREFAQLKNLSNYLGLLNPSSNTYNPSLTSEFTVSREHGDHKTSIDTITSNPWTSFPNSEFNHFRKRRYSSISSNIKYFLSPSGKHKKGVVRHVILITHSLGECSLQERWAILLKAYQVKPWVMCHIVHMDSKGYPLNRGVFFPTLCNRNARFLENESSLSTKKSSYSTKDPSLQYSCLNKIFGVNANLTSCKNDFLVSHSPNLGNQIESLSPTKNTDNKNEGVLTVVQGSSELLPSADSHVTYYQASPAAKNGIVGLNEEVLSYGDIFWLRDEAFFRSLTTITNGIYRRTETIQQINDVFQEIIYDSCGLSVFTELSLTVEESSENLLPMIVTPRLCGDWLTVITSKKAFNPFSQNLPAGGEYLLYLLYVIRDDTPPISSLNLSINLSGFCNGFIHQWKENITLASESHSYEKIPLLVSSRSDSFVTCRDAYDAYMEFFYKRVFSMGSYISKKNLPENFLEKIRDVSEHLKGKSNSVSSLLTSHVKNEGLQKISLDNMTYFDESCLSSFKSSADKMYESDSSTHSAYSQEKLHKVGLVTRTNLISLGLSCSTDMSFWMNFMGQCWSNAEEILYTKETAIADLFESNMKAFITKSIKSNEPSDKLIRSSLSNQVTPHSSSVDGWKDYGPSIVSIINEEGDIKVTYLDARGTSVNFKWLVGLVNYCIEKAMDGLGNENKKILD